MKSLLCSMFLLCAVSAHAISASSFPKARTDDQKSIDDRYTVQVIYPTSKYTHGQLQCVILRDYAASSSGAIIKMQCVQDKE